MFNFKLLTKFFLTILQSLSLTNVLSLELCLLFHNFFFIFCCCWLLTHWQKLLLSAWLILRKKKFCVSTVDCRPNNKNITQKYWAIDCKFSKNILYIALRQLPHSHLLVTYLINYYDGLLCSFFYTITCSDSKHQQQSRLWDSFDSTIQLQNVNSNKTENRVEIKSNNIFNIARN
jgi:hypothetical protein